MMKNYNIVKYFVVINAQIQNAHVYVIQDMVQKKHLIHILKKIVLKVNL